MRFKFLGSEINVSFFFMAILTILLIFDKTGFIVPVFFATVFHETGHLLAMLLLKCQPKKINLIPGSIQIVRGFCVKRQGELLILLSGPMANLLLTSVFFALFFLTQNQFCLTFSAINLIIFSFNLLPVKNLDGGSILHLLLRKFLSESKCNLILDGISLLCGLLAVFFGVSGIMMGKINLSLAVLGVYVIMGVLVKI